MRACLRQRPKRLFGFDSKCRPVSGSPTASSAKGASISRPASRCSASFATLTAQSTANTNHNTRTSNLATTSKIQGAFQAQRIPHRSKPREGGPTSGDQGPARPPSLGFLLAFRSSASASWWNRPKRIFPTAAARDGKATKLGEFRTRGARGGPRLGGPKFARFCRLVARRAKPLRLGCFRTIRLFSPLFQGTFGKRNVCESVIVTPLPRWERVSS